MQLARGPQKRPDRLCEKVPKRNGRASQTEQRSHPDGNQDSDRYFVPHDQQYSMKIYTKTGDDGTTGLLGNARVRKDAPRIEAIGEVDELNASLGVVLAHLPSAA